MAVSALSARRSPSSGTATHACGRSSSGSALSSPPGAAPAALAGRLARRPRRGPRQRRARRRARAPAAPGGRPRPAHRGPLSARRPGPRRARGGHARPGGVATRPVASPPRGGPAAGRDVGLPAAAGLNLGALRRGHAPRHAAAGRSRPRGARRLGRARPGDRAATRAPRHAPVPLALGPGRPRPAGLRQPRRARPGGARARHARGAGRSGPLRRGSGRGTPAGRGAARRHHRLPDRSAQPPLAERLPRRDARGLSPPRTVARAAGRRPRRLQGAERHARTPRRRRAAS